MNNNIIKKECFIALFDILGFRDLIKNNDLEKVAQTYQKARSDFENNIQHIDALLQKDSVSFRIFSDTFLIYTSEVSDESFLALLAGLDFLFIAANENKLPIRGATAVGELIVSNGIEIGIPIVEAYENEQKQDWTGCWVGDSCLDRVNKDDHLSGRDIVEYEIPLKDGEVRKNYAFNWVKSIPNIIRSKHKKNDFTPEEIKKEIKFFRNKATKWSAKRKHENTRKFIDFVLTPEFLKEY
jgi:hypothetical protein